MRPNVRVSAMAKNRDNAQAGRAGAKGGQVLATSANLDNLEQVAMAMFFDRPGRGGSEEKKLKTMSWEQLGDKLINRFREIRANDERIPEGQPGAGEYVPCFTVLREGVDFDLDAKLPSIRQRVQRALCDDERRDELHRFDASNLKTRDIPKQRKLHGGKVVDVPNMIGILLTGLPPAVMTDEELAEAGIETADAEEAEEAAAE
jgi:hypothetical protein